MSQDKPIAYDPTLIDEHLDNMYEGWFLDYASYVILERAVPSLEDGLKPVQRRILHAMKEMDDGRFHKVANVIGQTMQYHPHGDAAIGDALVNLGQKDLLIDTQGNWGDFRTGDPAAAARYIESRLSKFGLEVAFNPETTEWQVSYDGRKKEPVHLPVKFPLILAQGVEGIAVGLSTKILPHNFNELIDASIKILKGKKTKIYPDFPSGGSMDVSDYDGGKRGGKVKVRAKIEAVDKKTLKIKELPYGVTTVSLIDSILKANDKGKIKIKKVIDNTAKEVEIIVELPSGVTTDKAIDALYAFTRCQESISPLACIIIDDKPHFLDVNEILELSTQRTLDLLKRELLIKKEHLQHRWHLASLERIFIEKRIYRDIEEVETWEGVIEAIDKGMHEYISTPSKPNKKKGSVEIFRDLTEEDIVRLTEIKIKRISKFDSFKADEQIKRIEDDISSVQNDIDNLIEYAVNYFKGLKKKFGSDKGRKTEITSFGVIDRTAVAANNVKLYADRKEGFIGTSLKKDEFLFECSDIDNILVMRKSGLIQIIKVEDKTFVGKDISYIGLWKKGDDRTTYNLVYTNLENKVTYVKRFQVKASTINREYDVFGGAKKSKLQYLSINPNAEAEVVQVTLTPGCNARKKMFDFDFSSIEIKGRASKGNILTKYPLKKVSLLEEGKSTIGGMKLWIDEGTGRVNADEYGIYLGEFFGNEDFLLVYQNGTYEIKNLELNQKLNWDEVIDFTILKKDTVITAVYFDDKKKAYHVKRFQIETSTYNQPFEYIGETEKNFLEFATTHPYPIMKFTHVKGREKQKVKEEIHLAEFIDVKGWRALGNKVNFKDPKKFEFTLPEIEIEEVVEELTAEKTVIEEGSEITPPKDVDYPENEGEQKSLFDE